MLCRETKDTAKDLSLMDSNFNLGNHVHQNVSQSGAKESDNSWPFSF